MERIEIIDAVGREYCTANIEKGEFSYPKAFKEKGLEFEPIKKKTGKGSWQFLDIRFESNGVSLLIETKNEADRWPTAEEQIRAYAEYEKRLTGNKIIAIVANTTNKRITVWKSEVEDGRKLIDETAIRTMPEYVAMFDAKHTNNKEEVMRNTYQLNEILHRHGIGEKLRSQFVGTCLLAIKEGLVYDRKMKTAQIIGGIRTILEDLLERSINKAEKLALIDKRVLKSQDIHSMDGETFCLILDFVKSRIYPFINDKNTVGQDLLNLFFVTFNKYVGKSDKNQAFTPDHITDFMTRICSVNKDSVVLDMACGSGSFLVRAMTQALADCSTKAEEDKVKKFHIYGVEYDELVYGLATTNMLIHSDGNSNIFQGSCFDVVPGLIDEEVKFDVVLMNPPYNAVAKQVEESYSKKWGKSKQDPSKGLYFVKFILEKMNDNNMHGKLAVLLPMACAIGSKALIKNMKKAILEKNSLDAVFSLPDDMFYPGASACACCMVFDIGVPHKSFNRETFFAYCKDDGFKKRKNLGRIEQIDENGNSLWVEIEKKWIDAYRNRDVIPGFSARQMVTGNDEWLCEAYMKTEYSTLTENDFRKTINLYLSYLVKTGKLSLKRNGVAKISRQLRSAKSWKEYLVDDLCASIYKVSSYDGEQLKRADILEDGAIPYVTRTELDNSVKALVSPAGIPDVETGNAIVIGDTTSTISYQPFSFVAGEHIVAARASWMNKYTGLFVVCLLRRERYRYSYGRAYTIDLIRNTKIKLPTTSEGAPDWQWIEDFIKSLPYGDVI